MKKYIHTVYVPPNGAYPEHSFKSRLTDECFQGLKDAKINMLYGHGWDDRPETIERILDLCEKYDIGYYARPHSCEMYLANKYNLSGATKPFIEFTKEEVDALDAEFIAEIKKYVNHKAYKGILFEDECGYLSYPGVLHAKEVFNREFPDLEFITNFFGMTINDDIFWARVNTEHLPIDKKDLPFQLEGDTAIKWENRFNFYPLLVDGLMGKSHFTYMSFDSYPYEFYFAEYKTIMHRMYIDAIAYFTSAKQKYQNKFTAFVQIGEWFTVERTVSQGEYNLLFHIQAMYGCDGFSYFPGFYPIDFIYDKGCYNEDNGEASFFDINGKPTKFLDYTIEINKYFSNIEDDILSSTFVGVKGYGTYYNGFPINEVKKLPDGKVVYDGTLPPFFVMDTQSLKVVDCTNNLVVGEFKREDKKRFYLTNMASLYENKISIKLPKGQYKLYRGKTIASLSDEFELTLNPGEGVYITEL